VIRARDIISVRGGLSLPCHCIVTLNIFILKNKEEIQGTTNTILKCADVLIGIDLTMSSILKTCLIKKTSFKIDIIEISMLNP